MSTAADVDVSAELARMLRELDRDPTRVLLVGPAVPDPLAETSVQRRPRPGDAIEFPQVDHDGVTTYVLEAHGAWHLRVDQPARVHVGDTVTVNVF